MPWVSYYTDSFPPMTDADKENNVTIIWNYLGGLGYTANAVAAICGNMEYEGILNPQQFEIGHDYDITQYGAGLCGWTPVYSQTNPLQHLGNWCDENGLNWLDGDSQLYYLDYELTDWNGTERFFRNPQAPQIGYPLEPPITASNFRLSELSPEELSTIWVLYYEHPANAPASYELRANAANKWWTFITQLPPPDPSGQYGKIKKHHMPIWLMFA